MRLSEQEYYHFLSLHARLIYFVGQKKGLLKRTESYEGFMNTTAKRKIESRNAVYDNISLIEDFIKANDFSEDDKSVLRGFKDFYAGEFFIVKYTKKHTLFLGKKHLFAVLALNDLIQGMLGNTVPQRVGAVLLPYKGKIVYDGFLMGAPIRFGSTIKQSINNEVELSKAKYGIIEQLPISVKETDQKLFLEKQLIAMMKTKASREFNEYEIDNLLNAHPHLLPIYSREWGRIYSRAKKKTLKKLGIKKKHFAIYEDTVLCSADSTTKLNKMILDLVKDEEYRKGIYVFKV